MSTSRITLAPVPHFKQSWYSGMQIKKGGIVAHRGSSFAATVNNPTTEPSFTYDSSTDEYTASEGWMLLAAGSAQDIIDNLQNGSLVPALATDLESWNGGSAPVQDTFSDPGRTTAGEVSIESGAGATVVKIVAKTDFFASALVFTGKNLLRRAVAVGSGYYFFVPALPFGTPGTATRPNGLLFTDSSRNNLTPTVNFKKLSDGVPTSITDGAACPYTDAEYEGETYRFYNPTEAGYIVVSGITLASTCARIAWSGNGFPYNEYVSVSDSADAGFSFDTATPIALVHNYNLLLVAGSKADYIERVSNTQAKWHRVVERVQPEWVNTLNEDGTYTHSANISDMAPGGEVECGSINFAVDGTTISYTDANTDGTTDYVKYELATEVSGTTNVSTHGACEDFGLEFFQGVTGSAYITLQYSQSYKDALRGRIDGGIAEDEKVIVEAILDNRARIDSLHNGLDRLGNAEADTLNVRDIPMVDGIPMILYAQGVPSASLVPVNWNVKTMGEWTGIPCFIGQVYINTDPEASQHHYDAIGTAAVSDWV